MIQHLLLKVLKVVVGLLLIGDFNNLGLSLFFGEKGDCPKIIESELKVSVATADKVVDDSKDVVKERYNKGMELFNAGKYKKAVEEFEDLLALIETDESMKKDYDDIKSYINKAQEKMDGLINNHLAKAKQSKKLSEQIKELKSALSIDNESTEIKKLIKEAEAKITEEVSKLYFKGVDLYATDKLQEAVKIWKEALELKPDHARIKKDLARAESKLQLLK